MLRLKNPTIVCLMLILMGGPLFSDPANAENPRYSKSFTTYYRDLEGRAQRNLPEHLSIGNSVTLKFFVTAEGYIRDASVVVSSGSNATDLYCVDALYCASPLQTPPKNRTPLPPSQELIPPDWYGVGIYSLTFQKRQSSVPVVGHKSIDFYYRIIPPEVLYRYPGVFQRGDISNSNNELDICIEPEHIEVMRFQWARFFQRNANPSRKDIFRFANLIVSQREALLEWNKSANRLGPEVLW